MSEIKELHPCLLCGKLTSNKKYCSIGCNNLHLTQMSKPKPCIICGSPAKSKRSKLCGNEVCRIEFAYRDMMKKLNELEETSQ